MAEIIAIDTREFEAAANQLFQTSSRTAIDFINGQALKAAWESLKLTHRADKAKLEYALGSIGRNVEFHELTKGKRKGKLRVKKGSYILAGEDTLASRILIDRRIKTGKWGISGNSIADKVQNLIQSRLRSVNFIRAGWLPAMNELWNRVKKKPSKVTNARDGAKIMGQPKGSALPAISIPEAVISNTALNTRPLPPSGSGNPLRTATEGLQKALSETAKDMLAELERRLKPDFERVSAK